MTSPRRQKARKNDSADTLTAEFTSGQLVIGICVSLFLCLICFLLGVLVGRYQPSIETGREEKTVTRTLPQPESSSDAADKKNAAAPPKPEQMADAQKPGQKKPATSTTSPRGTQTSPRVLTDTSTVPEKKAETNTPPQKEKDSYLQSGLNTKPRITRLPPLPPTRPQARTEEQKAPDRISRDNSGEPVKMIPLPEISEKTAQKPDETGKATATPEKKETPAPDKAAQTPAVTGTEEKKTESQSPPVKTEKGWGIQVASFQGKDKEVNARDYCRRLKDNANLSGQQYTSKDNAYCRVIITGYSTREDASAACMELKKKAGFADAFIRNVPPE